jgi:hypothetical protein
VRSIGDEDDPRQPALAQHPADRAERFERRPPMVLDEDRVGVDAMGDGELVRRRGLCRPVALLLAPGDDEDRRDPGEVERDGVVEPGSEDRRRAAVVLGGTEHDDRIRQALLVAVALLPDSPRGVAPDDHGRNGRADGEAGQVAAHEGRGRERGRWG